MQAGKSLFPRKLFNHKTINIRLYNAPGWGGRGEVSTLKISHCEGIISTFIIPGRDVTVSRPGALYQREGGRVSHFERKLCISG